MERQINKIDDGIFTVSNVFSCDECVALIAFAESIGFEAASVRTSNGPQMMTQIRNNDRVVVEDIELAERMWGRIQSFLPILDECVAFGIDAQLRFYRYFPGQQFKRHRDGVVTNQYGHASKLSYLVYLNDDCEGGSTNFLDYRELNGAREKVEFVVNPTPGTALLFRHERWHEGTPVTAGAKYVLRSDVFYAPQGTDSLIASAVHHAPAPLSLSPRAGEGCRRRQRCEAFFPLFSLPLAPCQWGDNWQLQANQAGLSSPPVSYRWKQRDSYQNVASTE